MHLLYVMQIALYICMLCVIVVKMNKRIAVYLRVSTHHQSTELQRREIEAYLRSKGESEWSIYEDTRSGTTSDRPELMRLMRDIGKNQIKTVVCWKLDRLFRTLKELVRVLNEFTQTSTMMIAVKDQIDMTTPSGRLMTHLLGAFAEFEADLIRERVRSGLQNAKRKGVRLGRPPRINAPQIQRLRAEGLSLSEIGRRLNVTKSAVSKTLKKLKSQTPEIIERKNAESAVAKTEDLETLVHRKDGQP